MIDISAPRIWRIICNTVIAAGGLTYIGFAMKIAIDWIHGRPLVENTPAMIIVSMTIVGIVLIRDALR